MSKVYPCACSIPEPEVSVNGQEVEVMFELPQELDIPGGCWARADAWCGGGQWVLDTSFTLVRWLVGAACMDQCTVLTPRRQLRLTGCAS